MNNPPIASGVQDANGSIHPSWAQWFTQAFKILFAAQQSGTTAQRPVTGLYVGRFYFDTSLGAKGKPIFRNKNNDGWITADGTDA